MLDADPPCRDIQRERPLRAVVDLKPSRQELVHAGLQLLDDVLWHARSVDTLAGYVAELQPVDRSRVAVARVSRLDVGDPVLEERGENLGAEFALGLL